MLRPQPFDRLRSGTSGVDSALERRAVGERLKSAECDRRGSNESRSYVFLLVLALLTTLASATAMADTLTCQGWLNWLNTRDDLANRPYNATLEQLNIPDEQIIGRLIPALVRKCWDDGQLEFTTAIKQALHSPDTPKPPAIDARPKPQANAAAPIPQIEDVAAESQAAPPKPKAREAQTKVKGQSHHHDHGVHTRQSRVARTFNQ